MPFILSFKMYKTFIQRCRYRVEASCTSKCCSYLLSGTDKMQKLICKTAGLSLAASVEPLDHHRHVASLRLSIGINLVDVYLNWSVYPLS